MTLQELLKARCKELPKSTPAFTATRVTALLKLVKNWAHPGGAIVRTFNFKNYHETMAFVNAVAWIAHRENHHPDLEVSYNKCIVKFSTHSVGGLSMNDFISAAGVNALVP